MTTLKGNEYLHFIFSKKIFSNFSKLYYLNLIIIILGKIAFFEIIFPREVYLNRRSLSLSFLGCQMNLLIFSFEFVRIYGRNSLKKMPNVDECLCDIDRQTQIPRKQGQQQATKPNKDST